MIPAHGDNVLLLDWNDAMSESRPELKFLRDRWPILYVIVSSPKNQSALHNALGRLGYVAMRLTADSTRELWRFHHPDGPQPL